MRPLSFLESACVEALDKGDMTAFFGMVDPTSVMELVTIARAALSSEDKRILGMLLDELVDYVKRSPDLTAERAELILRALHIRREIGI